MNKIYLPMWECQTCHYPFGRSENQLLKCPRCEGDRVPPSKDAIENAVLRHFCFLVDVDYDGLRLKSHEERNDYAHNILAALLSKKQREQLFQFFTIYFQDGFESGDISAWTGDIGSPAVVGSPVHHGSYALKINLVQEAVYKNITENSDTYMRFYIRFDALPAINETLYIAKLWDMGAGSNRFYLKVKNDSGTQKWGFEWESGGNFFAASPNPVVDVWYCYEVRCWDDTVNQNGELWIDSVSILSDATGASGVIAQALIDNQYSENACVFYVDCVVVADAYIGPEVGVSIPVMMHHYNRINKKIRG